jgi:hypothetical protein
MWSALLPISGSTLAQAVFDPFLDTKAWRGAEGVWIPPVEKHWHGDKSTTPMNQIATQEQLDGKTADWTQKVTDEQYQL